MRRKIYWRDGQTDRGKTVYPPPPLGSGGIIKHISHIERSKICSPAFFFNVKVYIYLVTLIEAIAPDSVVGGSDVVKMNPEA